MSFNDFVEFLNRMGGMTHNGTGFSQKEYQFTDIGYSASYSGNSVQIISKVHQHFYGVEEPHVVRTCIQTTIVSRFDPNDLMRPASFEISRMPNRAVTYLVRLVTRNNRTLIREEETLIQTPSGNSPIEGHVQRRDVYQTLLQFGSADAAQRCIEILNAAIN